MFISMLVEKDETFKDVENTLVNINQKRCKQHYYAGKFLQSLAMCPYIDVQK